MILASILRTHEVPSMAPWDKHFYLDSNFKQVFTELGITLFPAFTVPDPEEICRVVSADGKRAVTSPHPRLVGLSGCLLGSNKSGTAEDFTRLCLLQKRQRRFILANH